MQRNDIAKRLGLAGWWRDVPLPMRVLIDTDPAMGSLGGDPEDSFAIMLALASPELQVEGVTIVQGNVTVAQGYQNARYLLRMLGREDVPLHAGVEAPLAPDRTHVLRWLEGRRKLPSIVPECAPGDDEADAVDFLIDTLRACPGEITPITIGPLSNVARALDREPRLVEAIPRIVMMAGAAKVPGNITPTAEFNVWADPEAAAKVFASGVPITMVGLDVCEQTHLPRAALDGLTATKSALGCFVADATAPWMELRGSVLDSEDLHLYDSLAVAVAFRPDLVDLEGAVVEIETRGELTAGTTVSYVTPLSRALWQKGEPSVDVAVRVRADEFEALFDERVLAPLRS